jgi:hypothetical protein
MSSRVEVTLVCDLCGRENGVRGTIVTTRRLTVDRKTRVVEACKKCWPADVLTRLLKAGRPPNSN